MAIAGRVAIVPKGDWSADVTYKRLDAVTVNNTLYIAKKSVPAGTATTDTEYWAKSISGGATNVATSTEDGLMAKGDKKKLDGIDGDVAAKLGESKDGSLTYNGTEIKSSVETGKGLSIGEDGKLQVNIDGTTLTMDQVNNVIKLADTLKDAINGAFPAANVANNQITTVEGFALDARQANPNLDGTLAKQISDLNGSLERQEEKSCVLVNATGSASYIRNGFMVQVIMEITPTKLENGAILLKGLPRPQKYIYMTLPAINGNNIPCTLNANGELAIYFQDGGNSISRIDHIFCYMWI